MSNMDKDGEPVVSTIKAAMMMEDEEEKSHYIQEKKSRCV